MRTCCPRKLSLPCGWVICGARPLPRIVPQTYQCSACPEIAKQEYHLQGAGISLLVAGGLEMAVLLMLSQGSDWEVAHALSTDAAKSTGEQTSPV